MSDLQGHQDVGERLAVSVVAVDSQGVDGDLLLHRLQHLHHTTRSAHADGVTQGDLITTHGVESLSNLRHLQRGHLPFVGASENARYVPVRDKKKNITAYSMKDRPINYYPCSSNLLSGCS